MTTKQFISYCAAGSVLLVAILFSTPLFPQVVPGDGSTTGTSPGCLDLPRTKPDAIRKLYGCANTTEEYLQFDKKLTAAVSLPTQSERLNLFAVSNQDIALRLEELSANLKSLPAQELASSYSLDIAEMAKFLESPSASDPGEVNRLVRNRRWTLRNNEADGHLFKAHVATTSLCDEGSTSDSCLLAILEVSNLAVLARFAERLNAVYRDKAYDAAIEKEENIIARMKSVDEITPFQYPWELTLNRNWLDCAISSKNRNRYEGTSGILTSLPDCRWILLHPDVAFGYSPDSTEGAKSTEALVLELAGFVKYKFNKSKAENAWGVSVAATFADLAGSGNDTGIGLTFRYGKFGLTVSRHDHDTLFLLNLELFDSFGKARATYDEIIQRQ